MVNKIDAVAERSDIEAWATDRGLEVHFISAVTGAGLIGLIHTIADRVDERVREAPEREGFVLHRPLESGFTVARENETWVVIGRAAERAVNLSDLTVPEAADFAAKRLKYAGIEDALAAAGAVAGDDVQIGDIVFTFSTDTEDFEEDPEMLQ